MRGNDKGRCELSEEFEVNVWLYTPRICAMRIASAAENHHLAPAVTPQQQRQGSVLSPFLFAMVANVTEFTKHGVLCELLYADDLVIMIETIEGLRNK